MKCRISVAMFFLFSISCLSQNDINIISSNANSFTFEYKLRVNDSSVIKINNHENVNIPLKGTSIQPGSSGITLKVILKSIDGQLSRSVIGKLAVIR